VPGVWLAGEKRGAQCMAALGWCPATANKIGEVLAPAGIFYEVVHHVGLCFLDQRFPAG